MILLVWSSLISRFSPPLFHAFFSCASSWMRKGHFFSCRRCKTTEYTAFTNFGILRVFGIQKFKSPVTIPHICHFWDATIFLGLQKVPKKNCLAKKQRKFYFVYHTQCFSVFVCILGTLIGIFCFWL